MADRIGSDAEPSMGQVKCQMKQLLLNIKSLEDKFSELRNNSGELSDEEWRREMTSADSIKSHVTATLQTYSQENTLLSLKRSIKSKQRKRIRVRRQKSRLQAQRKQSLERRARLHATIDQSLAIQRQEVLKSKEIKEHADYARTVLSSVTKKITDAKNYLQQLNSLKELRRVSQIADQAVSSTSSADSYVEFAAKLDRLIAVWMDALAEYESEKSKLQAILNDSHKSLEDQWNEVIFGGGAISVESFKSYREESESFSKFLEIRRGWDSCIVSENYPCGSYIPTGWVLPPDNPSEKWKVYQK